MRRTLTARAAPGRPTTRNITTAKAAAAPAAVADILCANGIVLARNNKLTAAGRATVQYRLQEIIEAAARRTDPTVIGAQSASDADELARMGLDREVAIGCQEVQLSQAALARYAGERMIEGTFGTCHSCGEPMPAKRLLACPQALFCIPCQTRLENGVAEPPDVAPTLLRAAGIRVPLNAT